MPNDPGLAGDTCVFMEAIAGDHGIQNPGDVWWLSPDITLTGHTSGLENADVGSNRVDIRIHRHAANCNFPGDESVTVEVWIANPSLIMSPSLRGSAARVGFTGSPLPPEGGTHIQTIDFTVSPPSLPLLAPDDPRKAGPKCLVARGYPDSLRPSATKFFVPGDQHLAQHNLSIVKSSVDVRFKVNTFNPGATPQSPSPVKLRAIMDLAPSIFVKKTVLTRLHALPGFQRLRDTFLLQGFRFDLEGLTATNVIDHSHSPVGDFPLPVIPSFEATVTLAANLTQLTFLANTKAMQPGEAAIFHLTQTQQTVAQGGLTLVVVKT